MALIFQRETHTYWLNGKVVPSVTKIIDRVIPGWQAPEKYRIAGTRMHELCQLYDENFLDWEEVPAEQKPRVQAWANFRQSYKAEIVCVEKQMASEKYQFAGTMDVGMRDGKELVVCDRKSTIEPRVRLQLGFYALLWTETGVRPDKAVAVELRRDGIFKTVWMDRHELRLAEQSALALLSVYNFLTTYLKG